MFIRVGGVYNLSNIQFINQKKMKNGQKLVLIFDRLLKNASLRYLSSKIYNLRNKEGGHSVLVNYQSLISNFLPLAPLIISFLIKKRQNQLGLLLKNCIELPG